MADTSGPPVGRIGRFVLGRELGRGSMGIVYEAEQADLGRRVAVKLLPRDALDSPDRIAAFAHEARVAARVRHPGLVQVYDAGAEDGRSYLAMELVEGRSLDDVVAGGPLAPSDAARLVAEVARAVHALHEHGIVHRDLKPSNVLIDAGGAPRVTDFGLAFVRGQADGDDDFVLAGTPGSMAPEQIHPSRGAVGPRSDVWGLGALLAFAATGRVPVAGDTPVEMIVSTVTRAALPLRELDPTLPRELEAIAAHCLARDPARRYASAAELADDLERFVRGEAIRAPIRGLRLWGRNLVRRQPALVTHVAAIAALWVVALFDFAVVGATDAWFFVPMTALAVGLVGVSFVFDRAVRRGRSGAVAAWVVLDTVVIGVIATLGDGSASAVVQALPLLIAGSAAWRREGIVVLATGCAVVAYAALAIADGFRTGVPGRPLATHVIELVAQVLIGIVVGRLVARLRLVTSVAAQNRRVC